MVGKSCFCDEETERGRHRRPRGPVLMSSVQSPGSHPTPGLGAPHFTQNRVSSSPNTLPHLAQNLAGGPADGIAAGAGPGGGTATGTDPGGGAAAGAAPGAGSAGAKSVGVVWATTGDAKAGGPGGGYAATAGW
jgi:hypothetical protein